MRFPFFRNRDSVKNGILISIRRTGDGFHPGLFNILGKEEYKRIGRLFNGKRMCITLCKTNKNWDYGELQKYFEINKEKNIEDMMCDLDIKEKSYIRKLKERTQRVTKDSL